MSRGSFEARLTDGTDPRMVALVAELDREYEARFGAVALQYRPYNTLEGLKQACVILVNGEAVACGGLRQLEEQTAELKRVYVKPAFRRRGLARQLVEVLELQALFQGNTSMVLETGRAMPEAVALYSGLGYREIPGFGPFRDDPITVCMKKELE